MWFSRKINNTAADWTAAWCELEKSGLANNSNRREGTLWKLLLFTLAPVMRTKASFFSSISSIGEFKSSWQSRYRLAKLENFAHIWDCCCCLLEEPSSSQFWIQWSRLDLLDFRRLRSSLCWTVQWNVMHVHWLNCWDSQGVVDNGHNFQQGPVSHEDGRPRKCN